MLYCYFKGTSAWLSSSESLNHKGMLRRRASARLELVSMHCPALGAHQESLPTQSTQIRSIPQYFKHPESCLIPYTQQRLMSEHNRGHPSVRHRIPDMLLGEKSCQQGRSLISSSQILLFQNPLEVGSASFPPPNPLPAALATQRCLCQKTKEKSPHIHYAEEN